MEYRKDLLPSTASGGRVVQKDASAWRLELPPGDGQHYRLAQLDDYARLGRGAFLHRAPLTFSLRARASTESIPGTWGFGLWNDPAGMGFLAGGGLRLPALPNAAWFFFASPPNHLSLRDDLPATGSMTATFRSPEWHPLLLMLGSPALPLLLFAPLGRLLRRLARRIVRQDAAALEVQPTQWHAYRLDWKFDRVDFYVDGRLVHQTGVVPAGPLGLVIWVDNQYAAWAMDGRPRYGRLSDTQPAWIEVEELVMSA